MASYGVSTSSNSKMPLMGVMIILLVMAVPGCTTPVSHTNVPVSTYNKDTEYAIEDGPGGFSLTVFYSRYQFIPESSAVATACKSALTSIAWEIAERKGQEIEPVNEVRIRTSMGRNGVSGITSCKAFAVVEWKGDSAR